MSPFSTSSGDGALVAPKSHESNTEEKYINRVNDNTTPEEFDTIVVDYMADRMGIIGPRG